MSFKDIYTDDKVKEPTKKEISKDAYALGMTIDELCTNLEKLRLTF